MQLRSFVKESKWNRERDPISQLFNLTGFDCGWGNGYVLVPQGHQAWGLPYEEVPVDVHWGLTFGEKVTPEMAESWYLPEDTIGMWCFGFDTAHYDDNLAKWPRERVEEETEQLLQQFIALYGGTCMPPENTEDGGPEYDSAGFGPEDINKDQQEDDKYADAGL